MSPSKASAGQGSQFGEDGEGLPVLNADRLFALFDVDRDAILDISDVKEMLRELGIHAPQKRLVAAMLTFDEGTQRC